MNDFTPTTDFPEVIDQDTRAIASGAKQRDERIQSRRRTVLAAVSVLAVVALIAAAYPWPRVLIAVAVAYLVLRVGFTILGSFARPIPAPPPAGELRRVKLTYRCSSCGTELRMTLANDEVPQAPRHCADEMELTTAIEDVL
ncbi:MAG: hypothetical protein O3C27_05625 [Actinomycetota bacterium]|nr:hypothetical protein [Actinomycetota bacterium]